MALQEIEFTSRNRRDAIQAWAYEPVGTPAAIYPPGTVIPDAAVELMEKLLAAHNDD